MSDELYREVHRQLQRLSRYIDIFTRTMRSVTAFVLAIFILFMRSIVAFVRYLEPRINKMTRFIRWGAMTLSRKAGRVTRRLQAVEKRIEPIAVQAVKDVEMAVVQTAAHTVPRAKSIARKVGRVLLFLWIAAVAAMVVGSFIAAFQVQRR